MVSDCSLLLLLAIYDDKKRREESYIRGLWGAANQRKGGSQGKRRELVSKRGCTEAYYKLNKEDSELLIM